MTSDCSAVSATGGWYVEVECNALCSRIQLHIRQVRQRLVEQDLSGLNLRRRQDLSAGDVRMQLIDVVRRLNLLAGVFIVTDLVLSRSHCDLFLQIKKPT